MNKKMIVIVSAIVIIILITLIVQNQQLKSDKKQLSNDIKKMEEQLQDKKNNAPTMEVYVGARTTAEEFINTYFAFTNQPNKEDVMPFVTEDVAEQLSFQDEVETDDDFSDVITKVKDLEIYYGENTDERQEVFARFDSEIDIDGVKTHSPSFLKLDLILQNDNWKIDNMEFMQY